MMVEDDPGTQEVFRKHLEEWGVQVRVANNGEEAQTALETVVPDLILLDLMMPVMDGTAFLQHLRMDPAHSGIPVVICTGKELSAEEKDRLLEQATEVVAKGEGVDDRLRAILGRWFPAASPPSPEDSRQEGAEEA